MRQFTQTTAIAALSALGISAYVLSPDPYATWALLAVLAAGGGPLVFGLARKAIAGEFGSDLLAGLSIAVSALLGEYLAGAIVVLMLSGGSALEEYATRRASAVLGALAKRVPRVAHRKNGTGLTDIDVADIAIGDVLAVFPHEVCPVDAVVVEGYGGMDESYLTGEPFQIEKAPGAEVISGALNGEMVLTICASRLPVDSRYARIMRVMREAEANRPAMRRIADRLGAWYTVVALCVASVGWALGRDPDRFLAVLVIATPCPLLLAIPIAIVSAVSVAASRGIVIRNPALLERLRTCKTMVFDKTGTLTYGRPTLTDVVCAPGVSRDEVLRLAASLEQYSKHPLAAAIGEAARQEGIALAAVSEMSETPGAGLSGIVGGTRVRITGRSNWAGPLPPAAIGMECIVLRDGPFGDLHLVGDLRFRDVPREESAPFIRHLGPMHAVDRILLLSGDRESEVRDLAEEVGITEVLWGQSPEEKVAVVRAETARAPTLFVGDGINDAPAMQAATVGIAFGRNNDITSEAADAVLLEPSLRKVDELIHISRRMRRIALQSAVGGMGLSMIGMIAAAAGYLPPVAGAIAQEAIDAAAVLNALRMALPAGLLDDTHSQG